MVSNKIIELNKGDKYWFTAGSNNIEVIYDSENRPNNIFYFKSKNSGKILELRITEVFQYIEYHLDSKLKYLINNTEE